MLFADLKGSMELLADRDPEEARQLLDPVLDRMMEAVHRYEGTVNQVMGDGIMALFGAPIAHEDHAVRACYAGLAIQDAMRRYGEEVRGSHGVEIQIRVGLNSGEVVVRAIGNDLHMDYSAIGQTTHLAARMEQMAMPGSILITPAVLGLVEGYVHVKPLGPVPIKGLHEPVEVWELVGASGIRRRLQATAARGLTRFVGRETELTALVQAFERAGTGHGQVVALVGEAGMDKLREVAYGSLLLEQRRTLHARIVACLEALAFDRLAEQVDRLAHHAVRGEVWEKAVIYCRQAGTTAIERSAFREAIAAFEQALAAHQHLADSETTRTLAIDLRIDLRHALHPLGESERSIESLRQAEALAEALGDARRLGQVAGLIPASLWQLGDLQGSLAAAQRALTLATALGDVGLQVSARLSLGQSYWALSHHGHAVEVFSRNIEFLQGRSLPERFGLATIPLVSSHGFLAWSLSVCARSRPIATTASARYIARLDS